MIKLFDIQEGVAKPTAHCFTIGYLKDIIDEYGENAPKIFMYLHYMCSMNPNDNPFADRPEIEKKEIITRNICPELDIDTPLIELTLDLVKDLYETPHYRAFKAFKNTMDKISYELEYAKIHLTKEDGNSGEIQKAMKVYNDIKLNYKEAREAFMEEMQVTSSWGNKTRNQWSGKSEELG